jgi:NAD(P)-dependent dehydrogenase (short-subunit alcohol dehydrogenase family)
MKDFVMEGEILPFFQGFKKVTLITGGSKGIGAGCARVFVAAGADVVICSRGQKTGEALARELTALGPGTCHFEQCDVARPEQIQQVVEGTVALHGRLDCLINNAGQSRQGKTIDEFTVAEFQDLLQLNLVSYFATCKYALPHLRKTGGSIINMGSISGYVGLSRAVTYCTTKSGIIGLTKALAIDEAESGVRINAVVPGNIMTQSRADLAAKMDDGQAFHQWAESTQWMGRSGTPEEVGYACLFLASDAASFITGTEIMITGGIELGIGPKHPMPKF